MALLSFRVDLGSFQVDAAVKYLPYRKVQRRHMTNENSWQKKKCQWLSRIPLLEMLFKIMSECSAERMQISVDGKFIQDSLLDKAVVGNHGKYNVQYPPYIPGVIRCYFRLRTILKGSFIVRVIV